MMSRQFSLLQPTRLATKARRYSTTWKFGRGFLEVFTSTTRPRSTSQPLAIRTIPPTAATLLDSTIGRATLSRAPSSMTTSASVMQMSG
jgi:hypothetical protein